jgi:hypothetical protein
MHDIAHSFTSCIPLHCLARIAVSFNHKTRKKTLFIKDVVSAIFQICDTQETCSMHLFGQSQ